MYDSESQPEVWTGDQLAVHTQNVTTTHHMPWRWLTSLSGCSGSTAQELVVPTVAITKLGMSPACTGHAMV